RAGVDEAQLVVVGDAQDVGQRQVRWRCVDQLAARYHGGRLRQPGRKPERAHLASRLVARAGAAVEPLERRGVQEQRLPHPARGLSHRPRTHNEGSADDVTPWDVDWPDAAGATPAFAPAPRAAPRAAGTAAA